MKYRRKLIPLVGIIAGISLTSKTALADHSAHYLGLSYVSGVVDIWNWHEDNLYMQEESGGIPIGISYRYAKLFDSGLRLDAGVGPIVLIVGDVEYHDIPVQLSVGYSFSQASDFRPYARIGASIHNNNGDYVKDKAGVGVVGAIGFEYGNPGSPCFFMEASYDSAKTTLSTDQSNQYFTRRFSQEDIAVSDIQLTLGVRF